MPKPSEFLKKLTACFEREPKLLAATVSIRVRPNDETWPDFFIFGFINYLYFAMNNVLRIGAASGEFQFVRTDAFRKVNGFNEKLVVAEDQDLFQRLSKLGRIRIVLSLLAYHSGRRAHVVGWPKLLWKWWTNYFSLVVLRRSTSKEWEPLR